MAHWNLKDREKFHTREKSGNEMYLEALQRGLSNLCLFATKKAETKELDESWCNTLSLQIVEMRRVEGREPWGR